MMQAAFISLLSATVAVTVAVGQYYEPYPQQAYDPYASQYQPKYQPFHDPYAHQGYQQPAYQPSYQQTTYQQSAYQQPAYQHQAYQQQAYKPATYQQQAYKPATYQASYTQQSYTGNKHSRGYAQNSVTYSSGTGTPKSGYGGHSSHSSGYHSVVHKKKTKKQKIISIDKGLFIPGGTQAFGKFKSLKSCMKACAVSSGCFAGDYNPWLGKCYFHGNRTACATMSSHSKLTHFKKIPCTVPGAPRSKITLGAQLFGAVLQKGIKSLPACLKKCINAGSGIAPTPVSLVNPLTGGQQCFGIDYDFSAHKCYFHVVNRRRVATAAQALCPESNGANPINTPTDLVANPAVVNILVCPSTNG